MRDEIETASIKEKSPIGNWQLVILFLSVWVLLALFVDTVFRLPADASRILRIVDNAVCLVFIADFFVQLSIAPKKGEYLKWGWIDLVSSIPNFGLLRVGRLARVVRILRILRGVRSTRLIVRHVFANRAKGTFTAVALISFVFVIFSSLAILNVETDESANIKTPEEAIWWSFVTITTVGYGDFYPKSTLGRIIAAVLMTAGVGLFGTFTAYVASLFIEPELKEEISKEDEILRRLDRIEKQIQEIKSFDNVQS